MTASVACLLNPDAHAISVDRRDGERRKPFLR
jgi:hypothetical protein